MTPNARLELWFKHIREGKKKTEYLLQLESPYLPYQEHVQQLPHSKQMSKTINN